MLANQTQHNGKEWSPRISPTLPIGTVWIKFRVMLRIKGGEDIEKVSKFTACSRYDGIARRLWRKYLQHTQRFYGIHPGNCFSGRFQFSAHRTDRRGV